MSEENKSIGVEAFEMIEGLSERVNQLTLEVVAKNIIIRKLQEQLQGGSTELSEPSESK